MTRVQAGGADPFGDRFPTQPIAVGRRQGGLVLDDRPPRHHHAAATGGVSRRAPARTAAHPTRLTILIAVAVVIAATIGALGHRSWAVSSPAPPRSVPATGPAPEARQAGDLPRPHRPPGGDARDRNGALGQADGAVPDGVTVFDDDVPAVANLDPGLLGALRRAATDAADDRVEFVVNSGWRSPEYQDHLLDEAISKYGSKKEAARWVATADTSPHVSGDAIDIGPTATTAWLSKHGAEYGLCQIYRNEPWHYELRSDAADDGCPGMYADPTHDPRMHQ
ncbi:M15 family metallopeptidase [Pseudonocardia sp. DLS-67]